MTLVIGLILLIMISLAAVATYNMSRTSIEVVGNMQFQNEAIASADAVIQEALSSVRMFQTASNALANPCAGVPNRRCFDFNGDGINDITVALQTPTCSKVRPVPNRELDLSTIVPGETLPRDSNCAQGVQQVYGIDGAATGNSQCAASTWELVAVAQECAPGLPGCSATQNSTGATITVTQGTDVRVSTEDIATFCP